MEKLLRNRKAQTPGDAILIIVFLLILAIGGVVAFYITNEITDAFRTNPTMNKTAEAREAYDAAEAVNDKWDWLIFVVLIAGAISLVIIGYFIDVNSIFMILYIIALIIGLVISYIFSYIWEQISAEPTFNSIITTNFVITNHIMSNLPIYFIVIGCMAMVATYAKSRQE